MCWIVRRKHGDIFVFSIIYQHWHSLDNKKICVWKTRTSLSYIVNTMAADGMGTQQKPGHQQSWYWPSFPLIFMEYTGLSTTRMNMMMMCGSQCHLTQPKIYIYISCLTARGLLTHCDLLMSSCILVMVIIHVCLMHCIGAIWQHWCHLTT